MYAFNNAQYGLSSGSYGLVKSSSSVASGAVGISVGSSGTIEGCAANGNGAGGINANIRSRVYNCSANGNNLDGILVANTAFSNAKHGFVVGMGSTIKDCTANRNEGNGIEAVQNCYVEGNTCTANRFDGFDQNNDGAGIFVPGSQVEPTGRGCRIQSNLVTDNDRGIDVQGSGNLIIQNSAQSNTTDYVISSGNSYGPIVNVAGANDISGVSGAEHPWCNFQY